MICRYLDNLKCSRYRYINIIVLLPKLTLHKSKGIPNRPFHTQHFLKHMDTSEATYSMICNRQLKSVAVRVILFKPKSTCLQL